MRGPDGRDGGSSHGSGAGLGGIGGRDGGFGGSSNNGGGRDGYSPSTSDDRRGLTTRDGVDVAVGNEARDSWGSKAKGAVVGALTGTGIVGSWGTQSVIGALAQLDSQARVTGTKGSFGSALADQSGLSGLSGKIGSLGSGGTISSSQLNDALSGLSGGDRDAVINVLKNTPTNEAKASETPDQTAARITREQWQHYLTQFDPLERQLVGEVNSRDLVDSTRAGLDRQHQVGGDSIRRNIERFGLNLNGAQRAQLTRQHEMGNAVNNTYAMSNAFINQRDRNMALGGDLMQLGRGVAGQGISGMSDAAGMQSQRDSANAQAKAQSSAQRNSMIGGAIGTGVTAYMAGAGVKGALGSAALALI